MTIALWILAGGALGWLGFAVLGYNEARGLKTSVAIGAAGGFVGGKLIAPMFGGGAATPGDFSGAALVFAAAAAALFVYVGNFMHERWDI